MAKAKRDAAHPAKRGDTKLTITVDGQSYAYEFYLRPAKSRTDYSRSSGGDTYAEVAAQSDDAWFVLSKNGTYLGLLQEWTGSSPWCVQKIQGGSVGAIPKGGVLLSSMLICEPTWKDAVARAFAR